MRENMSLRVFSGDFKSGWADLKGFYLEPCDGATEHFALSQVQTLEQFGDFKVGMRNKTGLESPPLDTEILERLIASGTASDVPFFVQFKDGRKMIAIADPRTWQQLVATDEVTSRGLGEKPTFATPSAGDWPCEASGPIDWAAAAPSWASIIVGGISPLVAFVALISGIYFILNRVVERWIGYGTVPLWLIATLAFPLALIGTIAFAKVVLQSSRVDEIIKSKEVF
jgi:hypothetical protein